MDANHSKMLEMERNRVHANQYDAIAEEFERYSENNAYNALCERPATLSLLGDVTGKSSLMRPVVRASSPNSASNTERKRYTLLMEVRK